jgi:hypothetical protein
VVNRSGIVNPARFFEQGDPLSTIENASRYASAIRSGWSAALSATSRVSKLLDRAETQLELQPSFPRKGGPWGGFWRVVTVGHPRAE